MIAVVDEGVVEVDDLGSDWNRRPWDARESVGVDDGGADAGAGIGGAFDIPPGLGADRPAGDGEGLVSLETSLILEERDSVDEGPGEAAEGADATLDAIERDFDRRSERPVKGEIGKAVGLELEGHPGCDPGPGDAARIPEVGLHEMRWP